MADMIFKVENNNGLRDGDYTRYGYFVAVIKGRGYDGGGYNRHEGSFIVLADTRTGDPFEEPLYRAKLVLPNPVPSS